MAVSQTLLTWQLSTVLEVAEVSQVEVEGSGADVVPVSLTGRLSMSDINPPC